MMEKDFGSKHKSIKDVLKRVLLYCSGIRALLERYFILEIDPCWIIYT